MRAFALAMMLLLGAPAARADLAPQVLASLHVCATQAMPYDLALEQLAALGWATPAEGDRARVALAVAPYVLVMIQGEGLTGDWNADRAAGRLGRIIESEMERLAAEGHTLQTLTHATGAVLRLNTLRPGGVVADCLFSLPGTAVAEVNAALSLDLPDRSRPPLSLYFNFDHENPPPVDVTWLDFAAGALGDMQPPPILLMSPMQDAGQ